MQGGTRPPLPPAAATAPPFAGSTSTGLWGCCLLSCCPRSLPRCRDDESAQRMANLMRRFEDADADGWVCRGAGEGGAAGCMLARPPGSLGHLAGMHCLRIVLLPRQRVHPNKASSLAYHSNGVIDRAELKALLERVGGGADEVPLVRRVLGASGGLGAHAHLVKVCKDCTRCTPVACVGSADIWCWRGGG